MAKGSQRHQQWRSRTDWKDGIQLRLAHFESVEKLLPRCQVGWIFTRRGQACAVNPPLELSNLVMMMAD
jgi:hypothetical protein